MQIGYYPGCTLKTKARNLEDAAIRSMAELGVELQELERWNCCGAVYSLTDDDLVHILAPVRDLIRAKDQGYDKVMTLCSMCYNTLARANLLMRDNEEKRHTINSFLEEESDYSGEVEVVHLLGFLRDQVGWDKLKATVKKPLTDMKLAPYYGCTLTRPYEVSIDPAVSPEVFKDFVEALGAEFVDYSSAADCCGSYQIVSNPEAAYMASGMILKSAETSGADALILSCPLCEYSLGRRQNDVISANQGLKPMPVFYFTQLMALALGLDQAVSRFELKSPVSRNWLKEKQLIAG